MLCQLLCSIFYRKLQYSHIKPLCQVYCKILQICILLTVHIIHFSYVHLLRQVNFWFEESGEFDLRLWINLKQQLMTCNQPLKSGKSPHLYRQRRCQPYIQELPIVFVQISTPVWLSLIHIQMCIRDRSWSVNTSALLVGKMSCMGMSPKLMWLGISPRFCLFCI